MTKSVLVVDNDPFTLKLLNDLFGHQWRIRIETLVEDVTESIKNDPPSLFLLNVTLGHSDTDLIFETIHESLPETPIIVFTPVKQIKTGRDFVKRGAFWNLTTPLNVLDLEQVMNIAMTLEQYRQKALETQRDFQNLEEGIARISLPFEESLPKNFTFEQDEMIQGLIDLLTDILQVEIVSLMLMEPDTGELRIKAACGLDDSVIRNTVKKRGEGIAGRAAEEGRPLLIKDLQQDQNVRESPFYDQYSTKSLICVPLRAGSRVIGVLNANNKCSGRPFDEHDLYLTTIFSHLLVITLQNAQLHFDRERTLTRESKIGALSRKISATMESAHLFQMILDECSSLFQADCSWLFVLNEQGNELSVSYATTNKFEQKVLSTDVLKKWLPLRQQPNFVSGSGDREELQFFSKIRSQEARCWVSVPLILQDKLVGSLEITSVDRKRFKDSDKQTLSRLAQQTSLALNNLRLYGKLLSSLKEVSEARIEVDKIRRAT